MSYTIKVTKDMVSASTTLSVSPKHALAICRAVNRKRWKDAKVLVEGLADQSRPLTGRWKGKYYSKAASQILGLLNTLAANARQRAIEPEKAQLMISAHRGPTMWRGRRKRKFGMRLKLVHVQALLKPLPEQKVEQKNVEQKK
ncbi:MAG: uL22 family ribosomal protein [Candidatus Aenigmatarchaeota archaeon]|nr:hypothetical protein [Candidatus Aenigmarchaeota archaeon]